VLLDSAQPAQLEQQVRLELKGQPALLVLLDSARLAQLEQKAQLELKGQPALLVLLDSARLAQPVQQVRLELKGQPALLVLLDSARLAQPVQQVRLAAEQLEQPALKVQPAQLELAQLAQGARQDYKGHKAFRGQLEIKVQPDQVAFAVQRVHLALVQLARPE